MIRVALRSARRLFRDAVAGCLDAQPDFVVVGSVTDIADLPMLCELEHPDIVLIDVGAGLGADHALLAQLHGNPMVCRPVVVYQHLSPLEMSALLQLGMDSLVPDSLGFEALLVVLRRTLPSTPMSAAYSKVQAGLTDREEQIITLLRAGHTVNQIAQLLEISTSAVANAKRRIYRKLDVVSQSQVVVRATELGIARVRVKPVAEPSFGPAVVLRGAEGAAMTAVRAALQDARVARLRSATFLVLVDPAPRDWPDGHGPIPPMVLVRSSPPSRAEVLAALMRGAVAVISTDRVDTDLVSALTLATHGYLAIEAGAAGAMLDAVRAPTPTPSGLPVLTSRERDILRSIAQGHTVRLTARALGIAEKTVENTQARLFRKLGARNRPGALAVAHALGLLDLVPPA